MCKVKKSNWSAISDLKVPLVLDYCKSLISYHDNPLGSKNELHWFSPNNIDTLSREEVMRINEKITILSSSLNYFKNKENVWSEAWRVKTGLELSGLQTIQSRFLSTFTVEKTNKQATNTNPKNLKFTSWGVKKTATTTTTTMFNKTNQKQKAAEKYLSPVTIVGTQYICCS